MLTKGDATAHVRMDAMANHEALDNYFKLLKEVLEEHNLMDKPGQVYNVDESGMPLEASPPRVLAKVGQRKVRYRTSGNKSQITVVGCINAAGQSLPPFVIFDAKSLNVEWTVGEVPGTTYGLSDNGWIDMELFKGWLKDHFLKFAVSSRPLLLLLDGHSSHYNPEAIRLAKANDIILFTLVPHTTHEMQPLDTAVFGPLKLNWRNTCHDYIQNNPGRVITKYQFSNLLSKSWLKTMMPSTIIHGFKTCGIFPYNPAAVLDHDPFSTEEADTEEIHPPPSENPNSPGSSTSKCSDLAASNDQSYTFTPSEEELFSTRYAENFDLYCPKYNAWLKINHPDSIGAEGGATDLSLVRYFSGVLPEDPVGSDSVCDSGSISNPDVSNLPTSPTNPAQVETPASSSKSVSSNSSTPTSSASGKFATNPDMISKYLVQYVPATPKSRRVNTKRVTGSRVLTSSEGIAILNEKEEKKKKELAEKEKRKEEREAKKRQKEELGKKKAEEKANKANKVKRNAVKRQSSTSRNKEPTKKQKGGAETCVQSGLELAKPGCSSTEDPASENCTECCECLCTYDADIGNQTGAEWVMYACNRWLHEECIDSIVQDDEGDERFCSFCIV